MLFSDSSVSGFFDQDGVFHHTKDLAEYQKEIQLVNQD